MMDGTERHLKFTVAGPETDPRSAIDANTVEPRDNVRLDFYFVQVSKSYSHQIGIGFPGSIAPTFNVGFDARTGALDSATAVIESQPLPRLDMAAASGWAKVMRQAAVVTANGEKAVFSGGGEINVAVQTAFTTGVQRIQFGSEIALEPRYDARTGRIELQGPRRYLGARERSRDGNSRASHGETRHRREPRTRAVPGARRTYRQERAQLDLGVARD